MFLLERLRILIDYLGISHVSQIKCQVKVQIFVELRYKSTRSGCERIPDHQFKSGDSQNWHTLVTNPRAQCVMKSLKLRPSNRSLRLPVVRFKPGCANSELLPGKLGRQWIEHCVLIHSSFVVAPFAQRRNFN